MSAEEKLLDVVDDDDEDDQDETSPYLSWRRRHREKTKRKNQATIDQFLGPGRRTTVVGILPRYYVELLTWALNRYLESQNWRTVATLGYGGPEPVYIDVSTGYGTSENLPVSGQLLVEREDNHFSVTVDVNPRYGGSVQVQGSAEKKEKVQAFVDGFMTIAREENMYRGQKIEFSGRVHFLSVKDKSWDGIIVDPAIKREVRANTVEFLRDGERWIKYGIPQKRGVLLAGEPGTGKTIICKALMAEADGITCITTNAYKLCADEYIIDVYEMAQDLSPCIVFIEDIDLIGLNREEYHYQNGPALLALLDVLDGIEERQEIVTVATSNNWQALDRAINRRPSRFDRVIQLSLPLLEERRELVDLLCKKIPIEQQTQDYIARKTERCTPAQLQEIIYGLAIEYRKESCQAPSPYLQLSTDDIDRAISMINGNNSRRLGFDIENNHNHDEPYCVEELEKSEC